MQHKTVPKASAESCLDASGREGDSSSMILDMLDSLVDALDKKAEEVENTGDSDDDETRAKTLKDVAAVIRERFGL